MACGERTCRSSDRPASGRSRRPHCLPFPLWFELLVWFAFPMRTGRSPQMDIGFSGIIPNGCHQLALIAFVSRPDAAVEVKAGAAALAPGAGARPVGVANSAQTTIFAKVIRGRKWLAEQVMVER